jgi:hypothetical protein
MELEYREDRAAYRRHVRGTIFFVSAAVLYLPAVLLVLALLAAILGREAARSYTGAVILMCFVALPLTWLYRVSHGVSYRCPRCGRRLSFFFFLSSPGRKGTTLTATGDHPSL